MTLTTYQAFLRLEGTHPKNEFMSIKTWKTIHFKKESKEEKNIWQSVCIKGKSIDTINELYHTYWPFIVTNKIKRISKPCDCYKFKQPCDFQVRGNPQYFCSEFSKGLNHLKKISQPFNLENIIKDSLVQFPKCQTIEQPVATPSLGSTCYPKRHVRIWMSKLNYCLRLHLTIYLRTSKSKSLTELQLKEKWLVITIHYVVTQKV